MSWTGLKELCNDYARIIDEQRTHIATLESQLTWQPIETAPRDGSLIQVGRWYIRDKNDMRWYSNKVRWDAEYEDWMVDEYTSVGDGQTHWAPALAPPEVMQ